MKQLTVGLLIAAAAVAAGTWALAGPDGSTTVTAAPQPRFSIENGQGTAILLDCATGACWTMARSATGSECAWLPMRKLDDRKDALKWFDFQKVMRKQMAEKRK